jgi:hypothetical protein
VVESQGGLSPKPWRAILGVLSVGEAYLDTLICKVRPQCHLGWHLGVGQYGSTFVPSLGCGRIAMVGPAPPTLFMSVKLDGSWFLLLFGGSSDQVFVCVSQTISRTAGTV